MQHRSTSLRSRSIQATLQCLERGDPDPGRSKPLRSYILFVLVLLVASGCEPATFTEVQDEVLTPSCAFEGCHSAFLPERDLDLSAASSYDALVNVAAEEPGYQLVVPGEPDQSLLYTVLLGDVFGNGEDQERTLEKMPPGLDDDAGLSQQQLAAVRSWIADGAQNN